MTTQPLVRGGSIFWTGHGDYPATYGRSDVTVLANRLFKLVPLANWKVNAGGDFRRLAGRWTDEGETTVSRPLNTSSMATMAQAVETTLAKPRIQPCYL